MGEGVRKKKNIYRRAPFPADDSQPCFGLHGTVVSPSGKYVDAIAESPGGQQRNRPRTHVERKLNTLYQEADPPLARCSPVSGGWVDCIVLYCGLFFWRLLGLLL